MDLPVQINRQFEPLLAHVEQTRCAINASAAAVIVIQNDQIVAERYSGSHHDKSGASPVTYDSQFNVYSVRKTYIGLALALAVVEAGLDIDAPIHPYIDDIPQNELATIKLSDVLTKTNPKFFGQHKVEGEGLAGRVVKTVTGRTIAQLITERILEPLRLKKTEWAAVPKESLVCDYTSKDGYPSIRLESNEGHERNLYANAKDLAYWGYLHLNKGVVNGGEIIPSAVFNLLERLRTTPCYEGKRGKRVMGWYFDEGSFDTMGATGCHVVAIPKYNTVAVRMFNRYANEHTATLLNCLQQNTSQADVRESVG